MTRIRGSLIPAAALVAGAFALVYARSLTFVYIEGDDATTIAYHALGRNRVLQPPYSAYQCMMDGILSLFPRDEHILRTAAMLITGLAAPVLCLLIALLALDWADGLIKISRTAAVLLILLAAPEFFYLGLVYTPALVAMAAAVGAHLILRRVLRKQTEPGAAIFKNPRLWISALLFGLGAAFRWDVAAYGVIVAMDVYWLAPGIPKRKSARFLVVSFWGLAAASAWVTAAAINGYGPRMILKTLTSSGPVEAYPGVVVAAATVQPFATPALVLLAAIGFVVLLAHRHFLAILVLLGLALTARYLPYGVPKWFLIATPGLITCALVGFSVLWRSPGGWKAAAIRAALIACVLAPWLVGVHTLHGDSAYGPGFQVQPFDRPLHIQASVRPALSGGALVPTSEGPRPVGGHAWVLLGGGWREIVQDASAERSRAIEEAISKRLPLLQDLGPGYIVATLAGMGFTTHDPSKPSSPSLLLERNFISEDGKTQLLVLGVSVSDQKRLLTPAGVNLLQKSARASAVVWYGYTSTFRRCYQLAPDAMRKLGPSTAVVDLEKLRRGAESARGDTAGALAAASMQ